MEVKATLETRKNKAGNDCTFCTVVFMCVMPLAWRIKTVVFAFMNAMDCSCHMGHSLRQWLPLSCQ